MFYKLDKLILSTKNNGIKNCSTNKAVTEKKKHL